MYCQKLNYFAIIAKYLFLTTDNVKFIESKRQKGYNINWSLT
jgi:hypothetical protein